MINIEKLWNFERKWAKNNSWYVEPCGGMGWYECVCRVGWCWLEVVLTELVDDVVKSVDCGDCWQSSMIWMMTLYVFTGAGCAMSWMIIFWLNGERWLRHWMVGNGVESECVCGAGWVCWLGQWIVCVCVCGGGGDRIGWYWWWLGMCSLGLGVQWVGWLYILIVVGGGWVTGWWGMGRVRVCVCGAGWVLVRSVDRV